MVQLTNMEFVEGIAREARLSIEETVARIELIHKPLVGDAAIQAAIVHERRLASFVARHEADLREFCTDREVWESKTAARLSSGRRLGE